MERSASRPRPGEVRTILIIWDIDDPTKKDDPRYWWTAEDVERLQKSIPDFPVRAGRPKGTSLAQFRRQATDGRIEFIRSMFDDETTPVSVSLSHWDDADPDRTFFVVTHQRETTAEEREAFRDAPKPWPPDAEKLRQEWLAAEKDGHAERARERRAEFQAKLHERRWFSPIWKPEQAVEIEPGVFVQDERPS